MNKKGAGDNKMLSIIILFMVIIIALSFIPSVANSRASQTTKTDVANQSVDVSTAYVGDNEVNESINFTIYTQNAWKQNECPLTSVTLLNGANTSLTLDTDYKLYTTKGVFSLLNTSKTVPATSLNISKATYTHCPDGYLTNSGDRALTSLWTTLMIITLLVIAAGAAYGIINE